MKKSYEIKNEDISFEDYRSSKIQEIVRLRIQSSIREYLSLNKISRAELARKLKVDKSLITKWLNKGKSPPNLSINTLVDMQLKGLNIFKFDFALVINNEKLRFDEEQIRRDAEKVKLYHRPRPGRFDQKDNGDEQFTSFGN